MKIIEREFGYMKDKPVMILRKAYGKDNKNRFVIKLDDIWKYSDTHNELFESFFANKVIQICMLVGVDIPKGEKAFVQLMSSISDTIMEGIDELVKMPPYVSGKDDPDMVIDNSGGNMMTPGVGDAPMGVMH